MSTGPIVWRPGPARRLAHAGSLLARAAIAAQRRRALYDPAMEAHAAQDLLRRVQELPQDTVRACTLVELPCDRPPFRDSGLDLEPGEQVSTFAWGRTWLSKPLDVWVGPHVQVWARIGDGPVCRGARVTNTFTADRRGRLKLGTCLPAAWADRDGRLATSPRVFEQASGTIRVVVVVWASGADQRAALELLPAEKPDHLHDPIAAPGGWEYKWQLGDAELFSDGARPDRRAVCCHTHEDVGVIDRKVDMPLTAATRLRWRWRVDRLPSSLAEDSVLTHDYMSIAVEFDNGQDITYYWSASLPPGYTYPCPLPQWKHIETHIVLRSGARQLGQWLAEDRAVREDYQRAVGPPPERIVALWLIGNSLFQRGTGSSRYEDIQLVDGQRTLSL